MNPRRLGFLASSIVLLRVLPSLLILGLAVPAAAAGHHDSPVTSSIDGVWSRIEVVPKNAAQCAIFDPIRDRMIIFGGFLPDYSYSNQAFV